MDLSKKRVIVTGGGSGIGASAVKALAAAGAWVTSIDIAPEGGAVAECANIAGPGRASFRQASVADRAAMIRGVDGAVAEMGGLDALVNAAGIQQYKPAEELTDADWDRILDVNARGTMISNQLAFPHLKANGGGCILNFASAAGMNGVVGCAHYSASKGAVLAWTRVIAHEWGKYGIRANAVAPGMWTAMYDKTRAGKSPEELKAHDHYMASMIPLGGKLGEPDADMAPVLLFLVSDGARFITGQTIPVDGGMQMVR